MVGSDRQLLLTHISIHPFSDIFTGDNNFKLGDFGLATSLSNSKDVGEGDTRYMPKELLDDDRGDLSKANIFSLGLTVCELLSGVELPLNGALWHELRHGLVPQPLDSLHDLVVVSMMEPDYRKRPSTAELLE